MSNVVKFPSRDETPPAPDAQAPRRPQLEDGFTRINNDLLEALISSPFTDRERRVAFAVVRLTYGWNRKQARATGGLLAKVAGLPANKCSAVLSGLIAKGVIKRHGGSRSPVSLNKNLAEWDLEAPERVVPTPQPKRDESHQNGQTQSHQNGVASKDRKDTPSTDVEGDAPKPRRQRLDLKVFADQVELATLQAFAEHRRAMRSPLTQRALELTVAAAVKAAEELGITAEQAIDEAIAAGWRTVRTDWLRNRGAASPGTTSDAPACPHAEILAAWDAELGDAKGTAPSLVDWRGTKACALLEERWAENFNARNASGTVRYTDTETGIAWWRLAFQTIKAKPNFMNSDVDLFNLFHKETFVRAAKGKLTSQRGATR